MQERGYAQWPGVSIPERKTNEQNLIRFESMENEHAFELSVHCVTKQRQLEDVTRGPFPVSTIGVLLWMSAVASN